MNALLEKQQAAWKCRGRPSHANLTALHEIDKDIATEPVDLSKTACVVLAGGMGSRLGIDGPKGCVKLPKFQNKSLFELMLEKTQGMPVAVMTSPLNHEMTQKALQDAPVTLFCQEMLPVLDDEGNWIGDEPLAGPDGNGKVFANLHKANILQKWQEQGIQYLSIIPIDNPLADPKNTLLLSALEDGTDLAVTAIEAEPIDEKTGVLALMDGKLHVAEYSESELKGPYRYPGLFACSLEFAMRVANVELPWHIAYKKFENKPVWKFEYFIFDLFQYAKSFKIVYQPRKECFAPIKQREDLL